MKKTITIFAVLFALSACTAVSGTDKLVEAWEDRAFFSAEITQLSISPIDTLAESGKIIVRKPDAIFETGAELIVFQGGRLWTFTTGSDVGTVRDMESFAYADIAVLIADLERDFVVSIAPVKGGFRLDGTGGEGNVVAFTATLDENYIPSRIRWEDIFGYITEIRFDKIALHDTGAKIEVPEGIEFIEE
ncbi:MAG TPA: hypothetical protein ENN07_03170 [candidate division Zixibacteria bacterium]|nr:hypothetical protein [candidate division Zixibacteria bacterium]